jgi:hypothetical protein
VTVDGTGVGRVVPCTSRLYCDSCKTMGSAMAAAGVCESQNARQVTTYDQRRTDKVTRLPGQVSAAN